MSEIPIASSYMPSQPGKVPPSMSACSRATLCAPVFALTSPSKTCTQTEKLRELKRYRVRRNVGLVNRWRLPECLGSDMLGISQAIRALNQGLAHSKSSIVGIITSEAASQSVNSDMREPYNFRYISCHPGLRSCSPKQNARPMTSQSSLPPLKTSVTSKLLPMDLFRHHSERCKRTAPDILLNCLDMSWDLHRIMISESTTLTKLLMSNSNDSEKPKSVTKQVRIGGVARSSQRQTLKQTYICCDIDNTHVTHQALAIALGNLYHDRSEVNISDCPSVLAASHELGFERLRLFCVRSILENVSSGTICEAVYVAKKYKEEELVYSLHHWLELNLIPKLSKDINLKYLTEEMLTTILSSTRLFTDCEFSIYKLLCYWTFLQLNPNLTQMPPYSTLISYYNSLPKSTSFLNREEGQKFISIFKLLRHQGITDVRHIQDMQTMNVVTQRRIVHMLSQHYHSLQNGGDMGPMKNFYEDSVRFGFVIDQEPHYHSDILSLFGFHFEFKVQEVKTKNILEAAQKSYSFSIQRLRPSDPALTFRQCERDTFSQRPGREARYQIRVQYRNKCDSGVPGGEYRSQNTGEIVKRFSLIGKTSESQEITLSNLETPLYVSLLILFPQT